MAVPISIKNDLFNFVTVRSAQHVSQLALNLRFVFHPNIASSRVFTCEAIGREGETNVPLSVYLATFGGFTKYSQVQAIHSDLYDLSCELFQKQDISLFPSFDSTALSLSPLKASQVFEQLFYQLLSRKSKRVREACIQLLVADHIVQHQAALLAAGLKQVSDIKVVIPQEALACLKKWLRPSCRGELHGVNRLGIADFRRVEQEVCCYVPGEVSHIENIMAKEYKERNTRNLIRTELVTETTRETEIENLNDTTTTTRNEMSSEVANVLEKSRTANFGGSFGVSGQYPPEIGPEISANAYADFSTSNSSSQSNTEAKTYAEEVTRRALERIVQRNSSKRTSKIIKEFEEGNTHGFDNRSSEHHVTGIYRWVDLIYTNRLVNYGKRLMFEFLVPEPAVFFKKMLAYHPTEVIATGGGEDPKTPPPPIKTLADFGITNSGFIKGENEDMVNNAAAYYGVNVEWIAKEKIKSIHLVYNDLGFESSTKTTVVHFETIEQDYEAYKIIGSFTVNYKGNTYSRVVSYFHFANQSVGEDDYFCGGSGICNSPQPIQVNEFISPAVSNVINFHYRYKRVGGLDGSFYLYSRITEDAYTAWQQGIYNEMQQAYSQMQQAYEDALAQQEAGAEIEAAQEKDQKEKNIHPMMKRVIEQRELKRACIEMIMRPFCKEMGKNLYDELSVCGDKYKIPQIQLSSDLDDYSTEVRFFEQAFEWEMMAYLFYPYYWADKCDWGDLFQQEDDDLIFQAFKQAGMAKVLVPVRPDLSETVLYYLETGDIWLGGNLVAETDDENYLSITGDLKVIEGQVEKEWETRVPTTLTLLQAESAIVEESGLPCCHNHPANEVQSNTIKIRNNTLSALPSNNNETSPENGGEVVH